MRYRESVLSNKWLDLMIHMGLTIALIGLPLCFGIFIKLEPNLWWFFLTALGMLIATIAVAIDSIIKLIERINEMRGS